MGHSNSIVFVAALALCTDLVQGKDLLTQIMENASDPLGEGLLQTITLVGICALLVYLMTQRKGEVVEQITMADVIQADPSGASASADLGPEEKLYQALDKAEPLIQREISGELTMDGFLTVRNTIFKQVQDEFRGRKEELMQERLRFYGEQNWQEYAKRIGLAAQEFQKMLEERSQQAISHLGMDIQAYAMMNQAAGKNPAIAQKIQLHDAELARSFDLPKDGNFRESKAEIKAVLMEKMRQEGENNIKLASMSAPNQQALQQIAMVERTKVFDAIYLKHGLKINYLMAAAQHYQLTTDEDIVTLENSFKLKLKEKAESLQKSMALSEEHQALVDAEIEKLGDVDMDPRGLISIEFFMKLQEAVTTATFKIKAKGESEFQTKRRQTLKDGKTAEYEKMVIERSNEARAKQVSIVKRILDKKGIPEQMWQQSSQFYLQNPQFQQQIQATQTKVMQQLSADHLNSNSSENAEVLSAEKTIEHIQRLEEEKAAAMTGLQQRAQREMMNQQTVQMMMEVEKMKAFDRLYDECGVGEEDIARAVKEHDLTNDPRFKTMIEGVQQRLKEKIMAAQGGRPPM